MSHTESLAIAPTSTAQQVREALAQFTGQEKWRRNEYWNFFLVTIASCLLTSTSTPPRLRASPPPYQSGRGRREIFDSIYESVSDKDWLHPVTMETVDKQFIARANEKWGLPNEKWILEGEWLQRRPDLLTWMRWAYWKLSKQRKPTGSVASPPTAGLVGQGAATNATSGDGQGSSSETRSVRTWKDVVLEK
ncbi:uncharacterized protein BP5553_09756 [Venustampulla echinocandica]|uniref:Uncharacterized protein n=1 Tax=Venustampulla echinocandica TaxID=2656787 RepID=A0A370TBY3_9HELO|nr:uncharacterized protein BP5553_09756 [Venustampulla echinocandica]RDL31547.1 hypothetical protein BP5553_09756 [Venustampulla echinocandica]